MSSGGWGRAGGAALDGNVLGEVRADQALNAVIGDDLNHADAGGDGFGDTDDDEFHDGRSPMESWRFAVTAI